MSNSDIRVFHYQEGSSDKIWAICTTKNQTSTFTVWFGKRNTKLNCKLVPSDQSADSRILEKMNKGYVELPDMTVDTDSCKTVKASQSLPSSAIPTALWYRINRPSQMSEVLERLDAIKTKLIEDWPTEARILQSLTLYKDLKQELISGSHEFTGGPLGVLLLHSLRRHFSDRTLNSEKSSLIDIADDYNNLLPDRFDDLNDYIFDSCASYLELMGYMSKTERSLLGDEHVLDVAKKHGVEHFTSVKNIKELAIAMGCINAPIDLSAIRPDQQSAFF